MRRLSVGFVMLVLVASACEVSPTGSQPDTGTGERTAPIGHTGPSITLADLPADPVLGPPELVLAGWEGQTIHSVCVEASVQAEVDEGTRLGTKEQARHAFSTLQLIELLLTRMGIEVVEGGCDATIAVSLSGSVLGANYDIGYCYTGAQYTGSMRFEGDGPDTSFSFGGTLGEPPQLILESDCGRAPTGGYRNAYRGWMAQFVGQLARIWGERASVVANLIDPWSSDKDLVVGATWQRMPEEFLVLLVQALTEPYSDPWQAAHILKKLGDRARGVVPSLIRAFDTIQSSDRSAIRDALVTITGERAPKSTDDWLLWWEQQ